MAQTIPETDFFKAGFPGDELARIVDYIPVAFSTNPQGPMVDDDDLAGYRIGAELGAAQTDTGHVLWALREFFGEDIDMVITLNSRRSGSWFDGVGLLARLATLPATEVNGGDFYVIAGNKGAVYRFSIDDAPAGGVSLWRGFVTTDTGSVKLATANIGGAFADLQDYRWRMQVQGQNPVKIKCWIDGVLLIDFEDSSANRLTAGGMAGPVTYGRVNGFDYKIRMVDYSMALPNGKLIIIDDFDRTATSGGTAHEQSGNLWWYGYGNQWTLGGVVGPTVTTNGRYGIETAIGAGIETIDGYHRVPPSADQWAEIKIHPGYSFGASNPNHKMGVFCRGSKSNTAQDMTGFAGYTLWAHPEDTPSNNFTISRWVAGVETVLSAASPTAPAVAKGDSVRLFVTGVGATVRLRAYLNDVLLIDFDDTNAARIVTVGIQGKYFDITDTVEFPSAFFSEWRVSGENKLGLSVLNEVGNPAGG